jgi:hypothetical protein
MISHTRRLLLATTALVGSSALALAAGPAMAACTSSSANTVVCAAPSAYTDVNTAIGAQTGPGLSVQVTSSGTVDTTGGPIVVPNTFNGAVSFDNAGLVGVLNTPSTSLGLIISGDATAAGNTIAVTNEGVINNAIVIGGFSPAGGTVSVANSGTINTGSPVSGYAIYTNSVGGSTVSSAAGSTIVGSVYVGAYGPYPASGAATGGVATATLLGDVGLVGGVATTPDNPSGFQGSLIDAFGPGGAAITVGARTGSLYANSASWYDATPSTTATTASGITTTIYSCPNGGCTTAYGGGASVTVKAGADVFGSVSAEGGPGVSAATIDGTVHETGSGAVYLSTAVPSNYTETQTIQTNASNQTLSYTDVTDTKTVGGGAQLIIDKSGVVEGGAALSAGGGSSATINGALGSDGTDGLSLDASGWHGATSQGYVYDPTSLKLTSSTTTNSSTNLAPTASLTIGSSGSVGGGVSLTAGGAITADVAGTIGAGAGGGGLSLASTAVNTTYSSAATYAYDGTGALASTTTVTSSGDTDSGGAITLTEDTTGKINGPVNANADGAIKATLGGTTGSVLLISQATNSTYGDKYVTPGGVTGDFTDANTATAAAAGGGVTLDVGTGATVGGPVYIAADQAVSATNQGLVTGAFTVQDSRFLQTSYATNSSQSTSSATGSTTIVTQPADSTYSYTDKDVGGAIDLHNNGVIVGATTANSPGAITFENAGGLNVGNISLTSQGTSSTTTSTDTQTVVNALNVATDATKGSTDTYSSQTSYSYASAPTGSSVTGTYAGIVGLLNPVVGGQYVGAAPAGSITQTADLASTITVSGVTYGVSVNANAGAYAQQNQSAGTSKTVDSYDGAGVYQGQTYASSSSSSSSSTVAPGGVSTVTVTGSVLYRNNVSQFGVGSANVNATGTGGASIVLDNGDVAGGVTASSAAVNRASTGNSTFSSSYGPSGPPLAYASTSTTTNASTTAGGAALVDLSAGANTVGGNVNAYGATTATVSLDAASTVAGSVNVAVQGSDSSSSNTTAVSYSPTTNLYTQTNTNANSYASAAINGAALATINGTVGGDVNVSTSGQTATANINNTVGGGVYVNASGVTSSSNQSQSFVQNGPALTFTSSSAYGDAGGDAVVTLTAPAAVAASKATLVGGYVEASGDHSATVTIGAGAIVGSDASAYSGAEADTASTVITYTKGVNTNQVQTWTNTYTGGAAAVTNLGTVNGSLGAYDNGDGTAMTTNQGVVNGGLEAYAGATNLVHTLTTTNLGALQATSNEVWAYTPVGGVASVTNNGTVFGGISAAGATTTVTNNGGVAGGIYAGQPVDAFTHTIVTTPTSTTDTTVASATLPVQTITINQNGLVLGGVQATGVGDYNPSTGGDIVTSVVNGAINLNTASVTTGVVGDAARADFSPTTGAVLSNVNVNLNGTGWLGLGPASAFSQAPTLTAAEQAVAPTGPLTGSIIGAQTVTHTGPGTFYFYGSGYDDRGTTSPADDVYDISAANFVNASGGVQFALTGSPSPTQVQSGYYAYGIDANVTNAGTFVLGALKALPSAPNLTSLLNPTNTVVSGVNVLVQGNFTQSSAGVLVAGVTPDLIRSAPVTITPGLSTEVLGAGSIFVVNAPFTLPANSTIPTSTPSFLKVNGNLSLAGSVSVAVNEGALYADGTSTPLIDATGAVSVSGATVTPNAASQFVGFKLTTAPGAGTDTVVSLTTVRTSYTTAAPDANAKSAAAALDSAVGPTIAAIKADAAGGAAFTSVQGFSQVQDMASVIAGLDWYLGPTAVAAALHDLGSGEFYGSLLAIDNTRALTDALSDFASAQSREGPTGVDVWLTPAYRSTNYDGDAATGASGLRANDAGIDGGVQFRTSQALSFGFAAGWGHNSVSGRDRDVSAGINTFSIGADATYQFGGFYGVGKFIYGRSNYHTTRIMPTLAREADATFSGDEWRGSAEIGYDVHTRMVGVLTPYASIDLRDASENGFTEPQALGAGLTNADAFGGPGGLALIVASRSHTFTSPTIGVKWGGYNWTLGKVTLSPDASISYTFLGDVSTAIQQQFVGGGSPFVTNGINPNGYATFALGLKGEIGNRASFWIRGSGDAGGRESGAGGSAGFAFNF